MEEQGLQLACPEWTADDFRTEKPFEWLYERRSNKFVLMQLVEVIAEKAGALSVKNFRILWKAYLESKAATKGSTWKSEIDLPNKPNYVPDLSCREYSVSNDGIQTADRYGFPIEVCSHPILPIRRLVNVDTGEVKTEIAFTRNGKWNRIIFSKETLANRAKITELAKCGIDVDSEKAQHLVRFLSSMEAQNYGDLPEDHTVSRLGWIGGYGFSPYAENLVFDGDAQYHDLYRSVTTHGDYDEWLKLAKETRAGSTVARMLLAASFASVLVAPCGALPFFVHIWGGAGAGKTVSLMQAASVWADPDRYMSTHDSTAVSQERNAGFRNSLPLCLDELQIIKDAKSHDQTIYKLAEGIGRGRGTKTGGIEKTLTWRNCILSTGEFPILNESSGAGAVNRVLEIDCHDEKLFADGHGAAEILRLNYGWAGKKFVQGLTPEVLTYAKETEELFFEQLLKSNASEKQARVASMILVGDALADLLIFGDGNTLSMDDLIPYLATKASADQNYRAYEWLMDWIASNPARFSQNQYHEYSGECWGGIDEEHHQGYIIKTVFDQKMRDAGYSASSFLSWAKRKELIQTDKNGQTKIWRIKGMQANARCVCIEMRGSKQPEPEKEEPEKEEPEKTEPEEEQEKMPF